MIVFFSAACAMLLLLKTHHYSHHLAETLRVPWYRRAREAVVPGATQNHPFRRLLRFPVLPHPLLLKLLLLLLLLLLLPPPLSPLPFVA